MIEWHFSPQDALRRWKGHSKSVILAITLSICISYVFAANQTHIPESPQYKIFSLTNITADQGAELLAEAKLGTVSKFPGSNTLLITASPNELIKATAILALADAEEKFAIRMISLRRTPYGAAAGLDNLPSNEQIAAGIGNISIGTFSSPPTDTTAARAIIDIHDNALLVVAPVNQLERIISAIEQPATLQEARKTIIRKPPKTQEQPTQPARPEQLATEQVVVEPRQPSEFAVTEPAVTPQGVPRTTQRYTPTPIRNGDEILKLNLPDKISIIDLVGLVGEYLGLDFMYDPAQIKGDVTLKLHGKLRGDLRVKDLYPLLESALKFRGFVTARKGNLVTIAPTAQALDIDPVLLADDRGRVETGDVIVTRVFQLKHIDTASAQNFLTTMKLATTVTPIAETGTLIVTGYAYRMPRIEELLEIIDMPGEPKEFRFRQLKFTMAKTLASKVKTLAEQLGTVSIAITAPTAPAPTRGRPPTRAPARPSTPTPSATKPTVYLDADERTNRVLMIGLTGQLDIVDALIDSLDVEQQDLRTMKLYKIEHVDAEEARKKLQELGVIGGTKTTTSTRITAAPGTPSPARSPATRTSTTTDTAEILVEEPQVVVIEMTNSLLVNATNEQHAQIEQILQYVDSRTKEEEIPYKVYPLENQKPEDLATILNQLIQETVKDKEGKIQQVIKKTEEEITIIPDENTFSLIVYASKKNQEWIKSLIEQLDKRRPQVLIDVTLVEIGEVDAFDYDLQLVRKFPRFEPGGQMDFLSTFIGNPGSGDMPSTFFPDKRIMEASSALGDGLSALGFYADSHIQALLSLMQKKGYGRVLAKPKILVNDNEQGHIDTTTTIYVSRSASTVVSTAGGDQPPISTSYTFDEFPSGIILDITPHISEGNLLRLEIKMSRSSQVAPEGGIKQNEPPPDKSENNIETIVTVPDKSTIILGGIITLEQAKQNWKVPLLGDVPLVGGLFRKIDNSSRQTKLYVFVKANILRPAKKNEGLTDLEQISEKNRLAFEKFEEKFQKYQDWPGIKPKPMDPLRVLDAE